MQLATPAAGQAAKSAAPWVAPYLDSRLCSIWDEVGAGLTHATEMYSKGLAGRHLLGDRGLEAGQRVARQGVVGVVGYGELIALGRGPGCRGLAVADGVVDGAVAVAEGVWVETGAVVDGAAVGADDGLCLSQRVAIVMNNLATVVPSEPPTALAMAVVISASEVAPPGIALNALVASVYNIELSIPALTQAVKAAPEPK